MTSSSPSKSQSPSPSKPADPQQHHHQQQQQQPMTALMSFLIGSLAGTCGSLAGMGGGFVMIPLMTSRRLLGLTQHQAHGTSLFAVTTTGIAGAISYGTNANTTSQANDTDRSSNSSNVDVTAAAAIAFCGMITARAGALATSRISEVTLRKALGVFMLCVAPLVPAKEYLRGSGSTAADSVSDSAKTGKDVSLERLIVPGMIGCCSGFLAGVFGVGGGAVVVPALTISTDMNHYQALGTSLCAMVPTAIVGTFTHYQKGNVVMRVAPALALGAFTGAYCGGKLGLSIPEKQLKYGFSTVMVILGLQALLK